jgi:hypothetical protein
MKSKLHFQTILAGVLVFVAASFLLGNRISAQQAFIPVYETDANSIFNKGWSKDSRFFIFQDLVVGIGHQSAAYKWFQYDVEAKQLSETSRSFFVPELAEAQLQQYEMVNQYGEVAYTWPSPNGRYLVYSGRRQRYEGYVGIVDLTTGNYLITDMEVYSPYDPDYGFSVKWSDDSTAFTVKTVTGFAANRVYYAFHFQPSLTDIAYTEITYSLIFNGYTPSIVDVFALSSNGQQALLAGYESLFLWNVLDPSQNRVLSENRVHWASFPAGTDNRILFLTSIGIMQYDVASGTMSTYDTTLSSAISTIGDVTDILMAPDGNHCALVSPGYTSGKSTLYILDTSSLGLNATAAPTLTPTNPDLPNSDAVNTPMKIFHKN